jgi:hypothetical protein
MKKLFLVKTIHYYIYYILLHHPPYIRISGQLATTTTSKQASKHFTEAKTSPFPAGVSKSGKLFFDGEP